MISKRTGSLWGMISDFPVVLPLCVFFVPLCYRIYPTVNGYTGVTSAIFVYLGALFLVYAVFGKYRQQFGFNYIDGLALCFLLFAILNSLLKYSDRFISDNNLLFLALLVVYPITKVSIRKPNSIVVLIYIILITGLIIQFTAFLQLFHVLPVMNPVYKATGVFFNPNIFCTYLTIQAPLIGYGAIKSRSSFLKILCFTYCAGTFIFNILLVSRAALLALILAIVFLLAASNIKKRYKQLALALALIGLVGGTLWSSYIKTGSADGRALIWKISFGMIANNPLSGSGLGTYKSRYNIYQAAYFKKASYAKSELLLADENYEPFNDFLGIGIEEGIIGLSLFIGLLLAVFLNKTTNEFQICIKACLLIFIVVSSFSYPLEEPFLLIVFFTFIAFYSSFEKERIWSMNYIFNFACIILVLLCFCRFYHINKWLGLKNAGKDSLKTYSANYYWLKNDPDFLLDYARKLYYDKNYDQAIKVTAKSRDLLPSVTAFEQLGTYNFYAQKTDSAEANFKKAASIVPGKYSPKFVLYNFYNLTNNTNQAKLTARAILAMQIKIPSIEIDMMKKEVTNFLDTVK